MFFGLSYFLFHALLLISGYFALTHSLLIKMPLFRVPRLFVDTPFCRKTLKAILMARARNAYARGVLSSLDILVKLACFVKKVAS
jgi:hypothetical protein